VIFSPEGKADVSRSNRVMAKKERDKREGKRHSYGRKKRMRVLFLYQTIKGSAGRPGENEAGREGSGKRRDPSMHGKRDRRRPRKNESAGADEGK